MSTSLKSGKCPSAGLLGLTSPRIYQLEKNIHRPTTSGADAESSPLLHSQDVDPDQIFSRALDIEMEKISSFYQLKELEIYGEVSDLLKAQESYEDESQEHHDNNDTPQPSSRSRNSDVMGTNGRPAMGHRNSTTNAKARPTSTVSPSNDGGVEDSDDDGDETAALNKSWPAKPKRSKSTKSSKSVPAGATGFSVHGDDLGTSTELAPSRRRMSNSYDDFAEQAFAAMYSSGITLKKRAISLFVQLCELKSFIQLNKTGFTKCLKKYDKIVDRSLKAKYIETVVAPAYPFRKETMQHLEENIARIEGVYAEVVTQGDVTEAKKELRLHLREHVVWERNTVWREMIGIERKAQAANMGLRRTLLGADNDPNKARLQGDDDHGMEMKELSTPVGRIRCPTWLFSSTMITLIGIVAIFFVLIFVPIMEEPEQQNCLAMLIFVSLLWATEVCGPLQCVRQATNHA